MNGKDALIGGRWRIVRRLGSQGGQGETFEVSDDQRQMTGQFVLKRVKLKESELRSKELTVSRFKAEIGILNAVKTLQHRNLVEIIDSSIDDEPPWFVMPFYSAGAMFEAKRNPEYLEDYRGKVDRVLQIVCDVAIALDVLRSAVRGFVHRDVKCSNIFFLNIGGSAILGDYGLIYADEVVGHETPAHDRMGPARWQPPELRLGGSTRHHPGTDIYLLGGVLYEALTGGQRIEEIESVAGDFSHEGEDFSIARFSDDFRVPALNLMLRHMLRRNPDLRISANTVAAQCKELLAAKAGQVNTKPIESNATDVASEFRNRQSFRDASFLQRELDEKANKIAQSFGLPNGDAQIGYKARQVVGVGSGETLNLKSKYDNARWSAIRVLVSFRYDQAKPALVHYNTVFVGRTAPDTEVVAVRDEDGSEWIAGEGVTNTDEIELLIREAVTSELSRLDARIDKEIRSL